MGLTLQTVEQLEALHAWAGDAGAKRHRQGTHRCVSPAETVARLRPLLPALGITRLSDVTRLDHVGVPVFMACRPNARSLSVFQGKGLDPDAARASALMEALEFWHAERVSLPLRRASARELRLGEALVDTDRLARTRIGAFHEHKRILWVEGWDLLASASRWVPYDVVHTDYTLPHVHASDSFVMSSNGLASGNHPLEALSHALCELVERDATAIWHARELGSTTRLDLSTVNDPDALAVLDRFSRAGLSVGVWDVRSDLELPCFLATIVDEEPDPGRGLYAARGMGCHLDRGVALLRALTEAAQSRLTLIAGARDDTDREQYLALRHPDALARVRAELAATATRPSRRFQESPSYAHDTHAEDVALILQILAAGGLDQVVVVDLTHPGIGVPVVRAVVPGLEPNHDSPGYRPGPRARP
jgi:ribosomal protein S12 methylthiotransferase accessory factor